MGDFNTLQNDVLAKLGLINEIYFKDSKNIFNKEGIFGGLTNSGLNIGASTINTSTASIINDLFNLNSSSTNIKVNTSAKDIYYATNVDNNISYKNLLISDIVKIPEIDKINEINCLSLLDYSDEDIYKKYTITKDEIQTYRYTLYNSTKNQIYNFMQGLYVLYNLFEPNTWQTYVSSIKNEEPDMTLFSIPTIERVGTSSYTYKVILDKDGYAARITSKTLSDYINKVTSNKTLLETITNSTTFNVFVARRLVYGWILLSNYCIGISYFKLNNPSNNPELNLLITNLYKLIENTNLNVMYNSLDNVTPTPTTDSRQVLEKTKLKLELFNWCITYLTDNPKKYSTIYQNKKSLNILNIKYSLSKSLYPTLKTDTNDTIKTQILESDSDSLYNALYTIGFSDSTQPTTSDLEILGTKKSLIVKQRQDYINKISNSSNQLNSQSNGVFKDLNKSVGAYMGSYNNRQNRINDVSELLATGKTDLLTIQKLLNGRISIQKTQKICEYVAMVIMIIFALFAMCIVVVDFDKKKKLYACVGLILFSLVNFLGIQILLNSSIFAIQATPTSVIENFTSTVSSEVLNFVEYYNVAVMTEFNKYLDNTFILVTLLGTYKAYGNINTSMQRELEYYNEMVAQLNISEKKINNIYFSSYINTVDTSAILQLFQVLTIIIAGTCTGMVITQDIENNSSIRKTIAVTAGVLCVISLVIYLLEINNRVRTNPKKYYWKNPTAAALDM